MSCQCTLGRGATPAHHAGAHGLVAHPVDEDEGAGALDLVEWIEGQRIAQGEMHLAHLIEPEGTGRFGLVGVHIRAAAHGGDACPHRPGAQLEQIGTPRLQRLLGHPDHVGEISSESWGRGWLRRECRRARHPPHLPASA